jgi:RNA ligase
VLITHIDQVLPHVEGRKDFVIARKDGYTVIDYVFAGPDTFDEPIRLECRGIKFAPDGPILARPFHKFFNIGEKPHTLPEIVDFTAPHVIFDKLDGSMVHPAIVHGQLVLMTRMGHTDVAKKAEKLLTDVQRMMLVDFLVDGGVTPIFEFIAPDNRIIIKYQQAELVLLAARLTKSGAYVTPAGVETIATTLGVRCVSTVPGAWTSAQDFLAWSRTCLGLEGFVVRFGDGLWVKAKGDDYVVKHKAKDGLTHEKNVLGLILAGGVDDVLPLLDEPDKKALLAYADAVQCGVMFTAGRVHGLVDLGKGLDQKTFATVTLADQETWIRTMAFRARKMGESPIDTVKAYIADRLGSQTDVDAIRPIFRATWGL